MSGSAEERLRGGRAGGGGSRGRFAVCAGLCVTATVGVVALRSKSSGSLYGTALNLVEPLVGSPTGVAGVASDAADLSLMLDTAQILNNVSVYKRTSMSRDGKGECDWWESFAHPEYALSIGNTNFTNKDTSRAPDQNDCADRCSIVTTAYNLHDVESHRALHGPISAADWIASWNRLHGVFDEAWLWNEWMANALSFWVPMLDTNVANLKQHDMSFLGRVYANPIDGVTTYAVYFVNPFTGGIIELHSAVCSQCGDFKGYSPDECEQAAHLHMSTAELDAIAVNGMGMSEAPGSDDDVASTYYNETWNMVRISMPATHVGEIDKLRQVYQLDVDTHIQSPTTNCDFSNAMLNASVNVDGAAGSSNSSSAIELQFVNNKAARVGNMTVKMFETYVSELHGKLMGQNAGWDRFIDNHVGLYMGTYVALDAWKDILDTAGIPYMTHLSGSFDDDTPYDEQLIPGSIWTAGIGGLAVELNGYFDFSKFENVSAFFFCNPT